MEVTMIDFHSHIIFDVDDGSENYEMSIRMIENSIQEGVKILAATPHHIRGQFESSDQVFQEKFEKLKMHFEDGIELVPSMEIMVEEDLLDKLQQGVYRGYNNSKTILIEFDLMEYPNYAEQLFYDLKKMGYQVILAHPERNKALRHNPDNLYHLIDLGVLCQLNAGSLKGHFGEKTQVFAENLIERNLIHAVGSDGHNDSSRTTSIKYAFDRIQKLNPELFQWLNHNGSSLIHGESVEILDYKPWNEKERVKKKKNWFSFFNK